MSTYPTYTDKKCPKWEDSHSGDVSLYGKCCGTCMKQVRCKDNPDDYFVEDMSYKKKSES